MHPRRVRQQLPPHYNYNEHGNIHGPCVQCLKNRDVSKDLVCRRCAPAVPAAPVPPAALPAGAPPVVPPVPPVAGLEDQRAVDGLCAAEVHAQVSDSEASRHREGNL